MDRIVPAKLNVGDEIRIIAPSRSFNLLSQETIDIATNRIEELGLKVTFGKNIRNEIDKNYCCASIEDRIEDLHDAFRDKNVKAILTVIGGFNVNQILDYIDYELIKNNPKIICGFSDITALLTAITAKTGLVTYYGPHYSSFGMKKGFEYTLNYFKKIFMSNDDIIIANSEYWSDEAWFLNQEDRHFIKNDGIEVINKGSNEGKIVGGNLCTLNLLQGTEYMPKLDNTVLLIEDDEMAGEEFLREFDRNLQSLLHCYKNNKLNGIIIGRAQLSNKMDIDKWKSIINTKKELQNIPVIINANFGHTTPIFTFPIGGDIIVNDDKIIIKNI